MNLTFYFIRNFALQVLMLNRFGYGPIAINAENNKLSFCIFCFLQSRFASSTTKLTELSTSNTDIPHPIPTLPTLWPKPELSKIPNICLGHFDAVSVLNGTVHVFKNEYVYKLTPRYTVMNGYFKQ